MIADFFSFSPVRPCCFFTGGFLKAPDFFLQAAVLGLFKLIAPFFVLEPGAERALLTFDFFNDTATTEIYTAVQKVPVMGDQNKSFFAV